MATVTIIRGSARGQQIRNQTFTLVSGGGYKIEHGKGFVTVDGTKLNGKARTRISVSSKKDFVINEDAVSAKRGRHAKNIEVAENDDVMLEVDPEPESTETDAEVLARISKRFNILNKMTLGAREGDIRALFVVGAPGVGKTFGVEKTLTDAGIIEKFTGERKNFEIISGAMTPVGLYMKLYEFSNPNDVLVLDDCDSVFSDELALNLLKAGLDTSEHRMIHWNVDSAALRRGLPGGGISDVPNSFEFKGSIIFISNINFRAVRSQKMRAHLTALMSRSHFLDLTVHTEREKLLRIEDLVINHNMLEKFRLSEDDSKNVMAFVREKASEFNELSLRTVIKLAGLVKAIGNDPEMSWQDVATMSMTGNSMM